MTVLLCRPDGDELWTLEAPRQRNELVAAHRRERHAAGNATSIVLEESERVLEGHMHAVECPSQGLDCCDSALEGRPRARPSAGRTADRTNHDEFAIDLGFSPRL